MRRVVYILFLCRGWSRHGGQLQKKYATLAEDISEDIAKIVPMSIRGGLEMRIFNH